MSRCWEAWGLAIFDYATANSIQDPPDVLC